MAHIFKRNKTWSYSMYVGFDAKGKHKKVMKGGFRTKKEAEQAVTAIEFDLANGTYIHEKNITFSAFAKSWLKKYSKEVKASSARSRSYSIKKLNTFFEKIKLKSITKSQYQDMLIDLQDKGYSDNTISIIHITAGMIFKKAIELEVIKNDPTEYAKAPKRKETLEDIENEKDIPKYLEKEELKKFLDFAYAVGKKYDYIIFLVLSYTGMRVGELCALKWSDIDFDAHTIRITKTYYNPNSNLREFSLLPPKTKASRRTILVADKVINELKLHKDAQQEYKKSIIDKGKEWHEGEFVFCTNKYPGYPIYTKIVGYRMERLLEIAKLNQELTPHSLRHTHTSLLAEAGVSLEEIMERLGHTDDNTTKRIYLHVTKAMKKEAVHKFDVLMDNL